MQRKIIPLFTLFLVAVCHSAPCVADASGSQALTSAGSVPGAVAEIRSTLEKQGFEIPLIVDHAAAAASVGMELPPTQVLFARPARYFERALLKRSATLGIDLPLKFLVFEQDGEIRINSNLAGYLADRHDIALRDLLFNVLSASAEQFSQAPDGLITVESLRGVDDTVDGLLTAIRANPAFRVPLVLDYSDATHHERWFRKDLNRSVLIVFGNPNAGTPLMQADRRIAIDLPQKFLVWEDRSGTVNITYNDPFFIADRHNVQGQDNRLNAIANALEQFALAGAGKN